MKIAWKDLIGHLNNLKNRKKKANAQQSVCVHVGQKPATPHIRDRWAKEKKLILVILTQFRSLISFMLTRLIGNGRLKLMIDYLLIK